jgi:putative chitobiose transport system permease protein
MTPFPDLARHSAPALLWRYAALFGVFLLMVGPFLWLLSTALKSPTENIYAFPPAFLPADPTLANFRQVLATQPFWQYLGNSVVVAALAVLLNLLLSSLAAYPLARMEFAQRRWIFGLLIASMMVPFQLLMIPVYELAIAMGLANTRLALVLPHACTAFGIFFMRQAFLGIPRRSGTHGRREPPTHLVVCHAATRAAIACNAGNLHLHRELGRLSLASHRAG